MDLRCCNVTMVLACATVLGYAPNGQAGSIDYFGQTPPGESPVVFAPGTISLPDRRETRIVFSPDGRECLIAVGETGRFKIMYSRNDDGKWSTPEPAYFIDLPFANEPFFAPDNQRVFFIGYVHNYLEADIYMSTREKQSWGKAVRLDSPINSTAEEYHPTASLNGTLYFYSTRDKPNSYIYRSRLESGKYSTIERVDIPSPYGAWDPFVAPDESYIIFTSIHPDGFGEEDQYITYYRNGLWTNPKNLGSRINTKKIEYGSYVSPDGKYYFFSRPENWGPNYAADIYWVKADFIDLLRKTNFVPYVRNPIPDATSAVNSLLTLVVPDATFFDDDGSNTLSYAASLTSGAPLPSWLTFDATTRTFSGTPPAVETLRIKLTATDSSGAAVSDEFGIDIRSPAGTRGRGADTGKR